MAVDMFLKLGTIQGESADSKHKNEIDILSWNWGMTQSGTMHLATGGGAGKASVRDIVFTKPICKATPVIIKACAKGTHHDKAVLTVRKAGAGGTTAAVEYFIITLEKAIITGYDTGAAAGDDTFTENVTINFAKFTIDYQPQGPDGSAMGGKVTSSWDIPQHEES